MSFADQSPVVTSSSDSPTDGSSDVYREYMARCQLRAANERAAEARELLRSLEEEVREARNAVGVAEDAARDAHLLIQRLARRAANRP